jgi:hypothetical protein
MALTTTIERITPSKAEKLLNRNKSNRKLRTGLAERYAFDMKAGKWTECVAPIVIYEDGDIADGQHRLWAIVDSQTTQTFIIARGVSRESGLNIDVGLPRNLVDNARISGADTDLTNRLIAVARVIATGNRGATGSQGTSNAAKLAMVDKYETPARWAIENAPSGRAFAHSLVLGAMGRAWYYEEDKARLAKFGEVLTKGFMENEGDSAAVAIRNYLLNAAQTGFSHRDVWGDTFFKVQNAIKYFMRRRKLTIIKSVKEETYPLPNAKAEKKAA